MIRSLRLRAPPTPKGESTRNIAYQQIIPHYAAPPANELPCPQFIGGGAQQFIGGCYDPEYIKYDIRIIGIYQDYLGTVIQ